MNDDPRSQMRAALAEIAASVSAAVQADPWPARLEPAVLREAVLAYPYRGGKALRPALLTWSCQALGGDAASALPAAVAVELFHTWTLVHDDIIDADDTRRGQPSAHRLAADLAASTYRVDTARAERFGEHMAILAGDIQQAWANAWLMRLRQRGVAADVVLAILDRLNSWINPDLISGEAVDVEFELRPADAVDAATIESMLHRKTAILLGFAAEAGAMIALGTADHDDPRVSALREFAIDAGIAFQLRDDWLGLYGDESRLGKPVGSDLRSGKRTWLFALGLARLSGTDYDRLDAAIGDPELSDRAVADIARLLRDCGAEAEIDRLAAGRIEGALARLTDLPASPARSHLQALATYLYDRDH